jgi:hypothetical protein
MSTNSTASARLVDFFSAIYILPFFLYFYYPNMGSPQKICFNFWDFFAYLDVALSDRDKSTTPILNREDGLLHPSLCNG